MNKCRVCVVIPAHNSETYIDKTLLSLKNQSLKPYKIVVVDDSSTDNTAKISEALGAIVIRVNRKYISATGTPLLAFVINVGIRECLNDDVDYVLISGSDDVYPENYLKHLIRSMIRDCVVVASGRVLGEPYDPIIPRGGGRAILTSFIEKTEPYKYIYGWEVELVIRAWMYGLKTRTYPDLIFYSQRRSTRNPTKYYFLGKAMRELGYPCFYSLLRFVFIGMNLGKEYLGNIVYGYMSHKPTDELSHLRKYTKKNYALKIIKFFQEMIKGRVT